MKKLIITSFLFAFGLFFIPATAYAHGPSIPPSCTKKNGDIKCDKRGCEQYCRHGKPHVIVVQKHVPVVTPASVEIERQIQALLRENSTLEARRIDAKRDAERDYARCRPQKHRKCVIDYSRYNRLTNQIASNNKEIERLRQKQRYVH